MHVAQVASGRAAGASTPAGDVDLLALVLGAEATDARPAFPATLEAALADGAGTETDDGSGPADGEPAPGGEEAAAALALAASLVAGLVAATDGVASAAADGAAADGDGPGGDGGVLPVAATALDARGAAPADIVAPTVGAATASATVATSAPDATAAPEATTAPGAATSPTAAVVPAADGTPAPAADVAAAPPTADVGAAPPVPEAEAAEETPSAVPQQAARAAADAIAGDGADRARPVAPHAPAAAGATRHGADEPGTRRHAAAELATTEHPALDLGTPDAGHASGAAPAGAEAAGGDTSGGPAAAGREAVRPPAGPGSDAARALLPEVPDAIQPDGSGVAKPAPSPAAPPEVVPRWSERVTDAIRLASSRNGDEIRLQLEPEGLGHIDVRLQLQGDGVRAVIVAEHESTRALLTSQQQVLEQAFARSEIRLAGFSVDVGSGHGSALPDSGAAGHGEPDGAAPSAARADEAGDGSELAAAPLPDGRVSVRV